MGRENGLTAGQTSQNDRGVLPLPQFDSISDADRKLVADQAAPLLLQLQGPRLGGPGAPMVLGTSIGEEMITPEWVNAENDDVAKTALRATGQTISIVQTKDPGAGIGGAPASSSPVVGYVRHAGGTGKIPRYRSQQCLGLRLLVNSRRSRLDRGKRSGRSDGAGPDGSGLSIDCPRALLRRYTDGDSRRDGPAERPADRE